MHADEVERSEATCERRERLTYEMALTSGVEHRVVVVRGNPVDVLRVDEKVSTRPMDENLGHVPSPR